MVKAILFDMDGTLVDLEPRYVSPIKDAVVETIGSIPQSKIDSALQELLSILGQKGIFLVPRTLWKIGRGFGMSRFQTLKFLLRSRKNYNINRFNFHFIKDAQHSLEFAQTHFKVGIVTSAFSDEIEEVKKRLPLLADLDVIVGFEDVDNPKPSDTPILTALELLEVKPIDCVFIGDLPLDMMAGKSAGVTTVGYLGDFGQFTSNYLKELHPDYIVQDHQDLLQLLGSFIDPPKVKKQVL